MFRVGLTGGIGSGKSEVARRLVAKGAYLVDSDALAREVVLRGTPGLAAVVAEFGPEVLAPDGSLDRDRLGAVVFSDPDARARLNAIVHPLIGAASARVLEAIPPDAIVVHDVPLLVEVGMAQAKTFDVVVVVATARERQLARLVHERGMTAADAAARIAAQAPLADKVAVADIVVTNDGPLGTLDAKVDELWAELQRRAATA